MTRHTSEHMDQDALATRPLSGRLILRLLQTLGPYKWLVFLGNLLLLGCVWADLRVIHEMSRLIDRPDLLTVPLFKLVLPFLLLAAANRIFGTTQFLVTAYATNRAMAGLRKQFFDRLMAQAKSFFDQHKAGWLVARSTGDMGVLGDFMTFALMMLVYLATAMIYALTKIYAIAPILLAPSLLTVPIAFAMTVWFRRRMSRAESGL